MRNAAKTSHLVFCHHILFSVLVLVTRVGHRPEWTIWICFCVIFFVGSHPMHTSCLSFCTTRTEVCRPCSRCPSFLALYLAFPRGGTSRFWHLHNRCLLVPVSVVVALLGAQQRAQVVDSRSEPQKPPHVWICLLLSTPVYHPKQPCSGAPRKPLKTISKVCFSLLQGEEPQWALDGRESSVSSLENTLLSQ